jgi:hypothetical protein
MSRYADNIFQSIDGAQGPPIAGASVYVYTATEQLADLTADGGGALSNPVTTDASGAFYFNADDGLYILEVWLNGRKLFRDEAVQVGAGLPIPDSVLAALAAPTGAGYSGFLQSGTGAVARTVLTELRDWVKPQQFGADPTGSNDSTDAILKAIARAGANGGVYIPPGLYKVSDYLDILDGLHIENFGARFIQQDATKSIFRASGVSNWALLGRSRLIGTRNPAGTSTTSTSSGIMINNCTP